MKVIQVDHDNRRQVQDFLCLPERIYAHNPLWVPPLAGEARHRFDRKHYHYYKHSQAVFFLAYQGETPVGRLAVLDNRLYNEYNHEKTAFFYLFESIPDHEVARGLFENGFQWAKERKLERMVGPKGFTSLDGLGLLIKGFEYRPALGQPYNPEYYPALIQELGFVNFRDIVSGYLGAEMQFPERIHELSARIQERRGLHIAYYLNRRELRHGLSYLKELYDGTLEGTSGGMPVSQDEADALIKQMIWLADPKLIKIVMKEDRPVGFLLAYPDISVGLMRTKGRIFPFGWITLLHELKTTRWININGAGMIEEYRGLGGTAILYSEMFKSVQENRRYRHAEIVQIGLENDKMLREMENFGVDFNKQHRIYQRTL